MNKKQPNRTQIRVNKAVMSESLERKIERMMSNGTPIGDAVTPVFTERKDGVLPETDIRTDKWEMSAMGGLAIANGAELARENKLKVVKDEPKEDTQGGESINTAK